MMTCRKIRWYFKRVDDEMLRARFSLQSCPAVTGTVSQSKKPTEIVMNGQGETWNLYPGLYYIKLGYN